MSTQLPFFKFNTNDWLTGKVQLLTATEKGIFIELVARIWHESGKIKNDEILHRLLRVEKGTLSDALQAFFDLGIMEEKDGFLCVKFINDQIKTHSEFIEKQREFGAKGGRPKKGEKANKKKEIREEKKEIRKESEEKIQPTPSNLYPQSVEDVLAIAASPLCGMRCSREQAEAYFTTRAATDWEDAARRKITPGNVPLDIKRWLMRDEQKKNAPQYNNKQPKDYYSNGNNLSNDPADFTRCDEV